MTIDQLLLSKEKRSVHPGNGDGNEFDRQQHTANDGFGCRRRKHKMHAKEFRFLSWGSLPGRKQEGQDQKHDHPMKHGDIQLPWTRPSRLKRRQVVRAAVESAPALHTEPIDLRLWSPAGWADLHKMYKRTRERLESNMNSSRNSWLTHHVQEDVGRYSTPSIR
jgi:hypothetical protein